MAWKLAGFCGSSLTLGFLGFLDPSSAEAKMAVGSAQAVLSIIVVSLALALVKIFFLYRKDMREANAKTEALLVEHTAAFTQLTESIKGFKESNYHLATIIDKKLVGD